MIGYIIWPKGDTGLHTCRVYKTPQEASDAAQEHADFHHRPYEVRVAYENGICLNPLPRNATPEMIERWMEREYADTRHIMREAERSIE